MQVTMYETVISLNYDIYRVFVLTVQTSTEGIIPVKDRHENGAIPLVISKCPSHFRLLWRIQDGT